MGQGLFSEHQVGPKGTGMRLWLMAFQNLIAESSWMIRELVGPGKASDVRSRVAPRGTEMRP